MDTQTVCLGLLTFGEASGYDLKKHFEATLDHVFATGFGSIYPALATLAEGGFIECLSGEGEGPTQRKVYRITARGEEELKRRLATSQPSHKVRSELLALLYFSHLVPPQRVAELLDERIAAMEGGLRHLARSGCPGEHRWPGSVRFVNGFASALIEAGVRYMKDHRHLLEQDRTTQP